MTLLYIVGATLAGGLLSVLISAALTVSLLARLVKNLVSLSTGVLLGTALLQVLPEAFESKADAHGLFLALLGGLLFFFALAFFIPSTAPLVKPDGVEDQNSNDPSCN